MRGFMAGLRNRAGRFTLSSVTAIVTLAAVMVGLTLTPATPVAQAAIPTLTRAEIIARAESAIGTTYGWGRESWVPNQGSGTGPDCSGYVLKCWEVPRTMLYQEEDAFSPRYTTAEFYNLRGPWTALSSRSSLKEGDALVKSSGSSGHVVLYAGGDAWNSPVIYEAPGTGLTIRRTSRYLGSEYRSIRRNSVTETASLIMDNPSAKSVGGTDLAGNWTRSSTASGYYGTDYQNAAGTTATAWARWTPRFPSSRAYTIYLRWTAGSSRASTVRVHVNTPAGQYKRYINQTINAGKWVSLGSYSFKAGYSTGSGSVSVWATGAKGNVVADAIMFVPN